MGPSRGRTCFEAHFRRLDFGVARRQKQRGLHQATIAGVDVRAAVQQKSHALVVVFERGHVNSLP
eukprot:2873449-Pyramimonas_sp.AAC.1